MKVAVLGNCQARSLAAALAWASPDIEATEIVWSGVRDETHAEQIRDSLAAYDLVLSQPYKGFRALRPKLIDRFAPRAIYYPRFYFTGLHPDARKMTVGPGSFQFGVWHSNLAMAAFVRGVPVQEAADLYNAYLYGVLGYYDDYARAEALQIDAGRQLGLDLAEAFEGWRGQVFADDPVHQHLTVGVAMAEALIAAHGLDRTPDEARGPLPADPLAGGFVWPIYPEVARRHTITGAAAPDVIFRNAERDPEVGLQQMLQEAYSAYAAAPEAVAAQPGLAEAVETLRREGV
ncbi:MAG: hypothetical protein BGN86_02445 [Caulobacterales bacterium 68-7]|nr:MAG: hypothetical protein BGN86_02445 [Caulobacterales bacterium 68-7]